jgi:syndecan 4
MLRVCEGDCSLHGVCVNGSCFCAPGFHGRGCELLACTGGGESTQGCNGKGECVEGVCACNDGWGGQDCAERACPKDCSGRGICSKGECTCMTGWSGPACDVPGCPGHCSGNGYCDGSTAHAVCKCYPGWEGLDCATSTCSKGCSGHGSCDANSTCRCDEGWAGFDCSLSECPEGCSGIGICLGGACMCPGNTFGAACELNVCAGTPPCNANGKCVISAPIDAATGLAIIGAVPEPRCECHEGYRGLDCSLADCKSGCSGRGECLGGMGPHAVAACLCEHGWGGADCSMPVCATNCSGRGACVNGSCWCEPGWSGPECSWQRCLFDCSGRGVCNGRGACHCAPGWRGLDCSLVADTSGDEGADASVVTRSCAAHCLDGCQEQCSAVQEVMGGEHADDCLLHCTDLCVPACGEAQGKARRRAEAEASRELPGSRSAQGAAPPPPPVAIARDARELLDEEVADGVSMPTMVEDRDPLREAGSESELDDLESMAATWAL